MSYPYKRIRISKHKTKDRHRLVMEEKLGRELLSSELVHHRNENKDDDDVDNLELTTRSEHARLHMTGKVLHECIKEKMSLAHKGKPVYSTAKLTSKQIMEIALLWSKGYSMRRIAKKYRVAHSTISAALSGKTLAYKGILLGE
jgi:DNA-binding CsgD family transcriptional regulator